jgi:hypothetical protein
LGKDIIFKPLISRVPIDGGGNRMTMAAIDDGSDVKFKDIVQVQVQNKETG